MFYSPLMAAAEAPPQAKPDPKVLGALLDLSIEANRMSRRLGHRLHPFASDSGRSRISWCRLCGRYACVDLDESSSPYGSGTTEPCRGSHR